METKTKITKKRKQVRFYKSKQNDEAIMISHGFETHPITDEWKCDYCKQVKEEFNKIHNLP